MKSALDRPPVHKISKEGPPFSCRWDGLPAPPPLIRLPPNHGLINYKDTKTKCRHLKKLTCKGTLRQVFIRVYGLEIQSVMMVFSTHLCELFPL
jgi:hypothetical protein